jgi:glyoxylase-like metal-dependent hydrolase (beta-lactamase superfamily II)
MRVFKIPVGPFEMNSYIIAPDSENVALLIDPGDEPERILQVVKEEALTPTKIVCTHAHIDHIRYLSSIKDVLKVPLYLHEDDLPLLEGMKDQALIFGLDSAPVPEVDGFLNDEDVFAIGDLEVKVLHTPGHSPGSLCFYSDGHLFAGDVLFKESIGRTDLYGGNFDRLIQSIRQKLFTLPDETIVHPGHGDDTTIAHEKAKNPFLR